MKILVKDLLKLNNRKCGVYLCGSEVENLVKFNEFDEFQVKPEIFDEIDERDLGKGEDRIPFESHHFTIACDESLQRQSNSLEDIIEDYMGGKYPDDLDNSVYSGYIDFYDGVPIMIRLLNISLNTKKTYYLNREYLEKFRNDILFKMNRHFIIPPVVIDIDEVSLEARYTTDNIKIKVSELDNPKYTFDCNTKMTDNLRELFTDDWFEGEPRIHEELLFLINGLTLEDDIKPIPLSKTPRISLSTYTDYEDDDAEWWDYGTSIWTLNLDGKPVILYSVDDGYYTEEGYSFVLDDEKFKEVRQLIRDIIVPKLEPIPEELFVTEDTELEFEDNDYMRHEIIDNTLHCIINTETYNNMKG